MLVQIINCEIAGKIADDRAGNTVKCDAVDQINKGRGVKNSVVCIEISGILNFF